MRRRTFLGLLVLSGASAAVAEVVLEGNRAQPAKSRQFGAYYPGTTGSYNFDKLETQLGGRLGVYSTFLSFESAPAAHTELAVAAHAHTILVAFQPKRGTGLAFADILGGLFDAKLTGWFHALAALPSKVVIRWAHEMNGSWEPYHPKYAGAGSSNCLSSRQFIDVWRYVVALQRKTTGPSNIRWMFCPNYSDIGGITMEAFYPGSDVVDVVGYDTYEGLDGSWNAPLSTLAGETNMKGQPSVYSRVSVLHRTAEIWIGEIGCIDEQDSLDITTTGAGHSKSDFINTVVMSPTSELPRLTTICWFDAIGTRDWRFDSSPAALAASRAIAKI